MYVYVCKCCSVRRAVVRPTVFSLWAIEFGSVLSLFTCNLFKSRKCERKSESDVLKYPLLSGL